MATPAEPGTRVTVRVRLLEPHERASGLPPDTAALPYDAFYRGVLQRAARLGDQAAIRTDAGRTVTGVLEEIEPADLHTFGRPVQAFVDMVGEIARLKDELR